MILLSRKSAGVLAAAALLSMILMARPSPGASESGEDVPGASPRGPAPPPADHHMHVWSEAARDALLRILSETREAEPPDVPTFDGEAVVKQLDAAGIRKGVLLSTAYFFGSPDVDFRDEYRKVREENDWVARQVAAHPDRLLAFFGVNPLAGYATREVERCASVPECSGIKLQLANSDVDLHDSTHVRALRDVFGAADRNELPVIVHLQTRREDFGRREVEIFVDRVVPAAPDIPIQVAHMGGDSRFDAPTRRAVEAFLTAFEEDPEGTANIYFDMALVPMPLSHARGDSARRARFDEMNQAFSEAVRRIGPDRIVFGTDFPEYPPGAYVEGLRKSLPLPDSLLRDLLDDRAPYLD